MEERVQGLLQRRVVVESELGRAGVLEDKKRYRELTQEHAYLSGVLEAWEKLQALRKQLADNQTLLKSEQDPEFAQMLREDTESLQAREAAIERELEDILIPPDPDDHRNTILELRAGTGGEEAALFVADCVRMYRLYADRSGWTCEPLAMFPSDKGGYKECVLAFTGHNVYRFLRYEGGIHRVQRVPATEAQGRIHTSAISVAVMLEPEEGEALALDPKDLQIDTFRASGAGGQHVNVTDSAVRITHRPTGVVVACQDERSQLKNKSKALRLLTAKVSDLERKRKEAETAGKRREQVGSGDRSEKIRTYNFPQNRVTDHRIGLTKHNLDQVMNGFLDDFTESLVRHARQRKLEGEGE